MKPLSTTLAAAELAAITAALRAHDGNVTAARAALGLSERTMARRMIVHGLHELASGLRAKARVRGPR